MTPMDKKVDFLGGQVKALMTFMLALIGTHPSPLLLKEEFEAAEQAGLAVVEGQTVSDEFLDGMRDANTQIAIGLRAVVARS